MTRDHLHEYGKKAEIYRVALVRSATLNPIQPGRLRIASKPELEAHTASLNECERLKQELDQIKAEWKCEDLEGAN